jgi:hypothetical protein
VRCKRELSWCRHVVEQARDRRRVFLNGPPGARVVETRGREPGLYESSVETREGAAGSAETMQQDDEVIGGSSGRLCLVESSLALGERSTVHDTARRAEKPTRSGIPAALHAPAVTPSCIGPQLCARRLAHPPRSSLSRSWILSSLG